MEQELEKNTLGCVLTRSARLFPERPALSLLGGETYTFKDLAEAARSLSRILADNGIEPGDKVALLSENRPNWAVVYFAATTMGAVIVPILTEFHPAAIHHIIRHSEAKAVFVSEKLFSKVEDGNFESNPLFFEIGTFALLEQGTTAEKIRELKRSGLRELRRIKEKALQAAQEGIAGIRGNQAAKPARDETVQECSTFGHENSEDDLAALIYTSGTTGHSKAVMLSHSGIVSNARDITSLIDVGPEDTFLSILPLPHTYECTLGLILPVIYGAHVFYLGKPPTARVMLPALAEVRPTCMLSVPLVLEKIFKVGILPKLTRNRFKRALYRIPFFRKKLHGVAGKKLYAAFGGRLRMLALGGAPIAPDVELFLREGRFPYAIGYGLTETSPLIAGSGTKNTRLGSTGPAYGKALLRIADPAPETGVGEIQVTGPYVMKGYFKDPELTAAAFTEDGWFKTGDLGRFDEDGCLFIKGRSKNVIIGPSGENIYPEEIESLILQSPNVLEALVMDVGQKIVARVYLDYQRIDEELGDAPSNKRKEYIRSLLSELRDQVNSRVSSFAKVHKIIEQTEPFEKTPTQKIKRYLYG